MNSNPSLNLRSLLKSVYERYAPEKLDNVDSILEHFHGREENLIQVLEEKYSILIADDGTFESDIEASNVSNTESGSEEEDNDEAQDGAVDENGDNEFLESDVEENATGSVLVSEDETYEVDGASDDQQEAEEYFDGESENQDLSDQQETDDDEEMSENGKDEENAEDHGKESVSESHVVDSQTVSFTYSDYSGTDDDMYVSEKEEEDMESENIPYHGNSPKKRSSSDRKFVTGKKTLIEPFSPSVSEEEVFENNTDNLGEDQYAYISPSAMSQSTTSPSFAGVRQSGTPTKAPEPPPYLPPTPCPFDERLPELEGLQVRTVEDVEQLSNKSAKFVPDREAKHLDKKEARNTGDVEQPKKEGLRIEVDDELDEPTKEVGRTRRELRKEIAALEEQLENDELCKKDRKKVKKQVKKLKKERKSMNRERSRSRKPRLNPASPRVGNSLMLNQPKQQLRRMRIPRSTSRPRRTSLERKVEDVKKDQDDQRTNSSNRGSKKVNNSTTSGTSKPNGLNLTKTVSKRKHSEQKVTFSPNDVTIEYAAPPSLPQGRVFSDRNFFVCWLLPLLNLAVLWVLGEVLSIVVFGSTNFPSVASFGLPPVSYWVPRLPRPYRVLDVAYTEGPPGAGKEPSRRQGQVAPLPNFFHTSRGGMEQSNAVWAAGIPEFEVQWVKETAVLLGDAPTFDNAGNMYISPINLCAGCTWGPAEDSPVVDGYRASDDQGVALVSLDENGERRWTLPGRGFALASPLVLDCPDGEQLVVHHPQRNRVVALSTDGELLWETVGFLPDDLHAPGSPAAAAAAAAGAQPGKPAPHAPHQDESGPEPAADAEGEEPVAQDGMQLVVTARARPREAKEKEDLDVNYDEYGERFLEAIRTPGRKPMFNFMRPKVGGFQGPFKHTEDAVRAKHNANGGWSRLEGDYTAASLMYLASADALVGTTFDGIVFALDRETGVPVAKPRKLSCAQFRYPEGGFQHLDARRRRQLMEISRRFLGHRREESGGRVAKSSGIEKSWKELEAAYEELDMLFGIQPLGDDGWDSGFLSKLFKKQTEEGVSSWSELSVILQGLAPFRSCVQSHFTVDSVSGLVYVLSSPRSPRKDEVFSAFAPGFQSSEEYWGKPADSNAHPNALVYQLKLVPDDADSSTKFRFQVVRTKTLLGAIRPNMVLSLNWDRTLAYVARTPRHVDALDSDTLEVLWSVDAKEEVIAPLAVITEGDSDEVYAVTRHYLVKIAWSAVQWRVEFSSIFKGGSGWPVGDVVCDDRTPPTVTATSVLIPVSAVRVLGGVQVTIQNALVSVDRWTGRVRYATATPEDSVGPVAVSPRGEYAVSNLPHRRALSRGMFGSELPPLVGGVTKFRSTKQDLHIRDIACQMLAIAKNAAKELGGWSISKEAHEIALLSALELEDLHYQSTAAFSRLISEQEAGSRPLEKGVESTVLHHMDKIKRALLPLSQSQRRLSAHFRRHDSYMMTTIVDSTYALCSIWK